MYYYNVYLGECVNFELSAPVSSLEEAKAEAKAYLALHPNARIECWSCSDKKYRSNTRLGYWYDQRFPTVPPRRIKKLHKYSFGTDKSPFGLLCGSWLSSYGIEVPLDPRVSFY